MSSAQTSKTQRMGLYIAGVQIDGNGNTVEMRLDSVVEASKPVRDSLHQLRPPPADFTGRKKELDELLANIGEGRSRVGALGFGLRIPATPY
jgi:hypothetical protein